jgi:predicted ATPase
LQRHILTGAPGAGKTIVLRQLELDGFAVVGEAATDLIALVTANGVERHWELPSFIDDILALQVLRQRRADAWPVATIVYDRSPICTLALARYIGRQPSPALRAEIDRIQREAVYAPRVFFVELLGFITPTEARRISLEESARFAEVHVETYRELGYELVFVPPGTPRGRADQVRQLISRG